MEGFEDQNETNPMESKKKQLFNNDQEISSPRSNHPKGIPH